MIDWLQNQMNHGPTPTYVDIFLRIVAAMILGCVVAAIHHYTRPADGPSTNGFMPTLVLLTILLAMVILAVDNQMARAFTLAGVLAIVRFRTVVKDTRDTAFVICAVIVGMAAGANYLAVAIFGLPVVAVAAYFTQLQQPAKPQRTSTLVVRYSLTVQLQQSVEEVLKRYVDNYAVKKSSTCKKGTAMDVAYRIRLKKGTQSPDLVRELHALDGMQSVEWKS